ncbi:uncharacterized protein E0L32_000575 [Thyridium curvatum]|uniref:Uncharacterized protein n=1 Tax=Thyridium curvatum TaxID=1093900 RepID=A0A507BAR8_9PEZI|nr:uncharacterized protein E0L32_000575 [Thyridium curvatum]TPX14181.1 hypothetical protein E0L32_000575 [Thyridium curvatum]
MSGHMASSGRGGAGNMVDSTKSPKLQPKDLETPTLKTSVVTTGRGGTGNMARNTDPAETRARQDVGPVTRRDSHGATLVGRGGGGNVFKPEDAEAARRARDESAVAVDTEDLRRVATGERMRESGKGKEKEAERERDGRAAADGHGGLAQKGRDWLMGKRS